MRATARGGVPVEHAGEDRGDAVVGWARAAWAPLVVCLVLVVVAAARADVAYNSTFDGFNTSVWASGSRLAREQGWVETRLGAGRPEDDAGRVPYAHHPPLLRVELVTAESLLGEHRWVARLPALLSSMAAICCCWGWLGALGLDRRARSLGVLVLGGTQLLLVYGLMLNMEAVWLPFAFGLLWAWREGELGRRGAATACGLLALVGGLAAHQGLLLAGGLAALGLVRAWRRHRRPEPHERAVLLGTVAGGAVFLAWVWWAAGGMDDLVRIAGVRSAGDVGWGPWLVGQLRFLTTVLGPLGLAAALCGPMLVRRRPSAVGVLAVIWAVAASYAVVFRQGAHLHPYWNVALLPAVALGAALCAERLASFGRSHVRAALLVASAALVLGGVASIRQAQVGRGLGELARIAGDRPAELFTTEIVAPWVRYESGRSVVGQVGDCSSLVELSERDPQAQVLSLRRWGPLGSAVVWRQVGASPGVMVRGDAVLAPAGVLATACR